MRVVVVGDIEGGPVVVTALVAGFFTFVVGVSVGAVAAAGTVRNPMALLRLIATTSTRRQDDDWVPRALMFAATSRGVRLSIPTAAAFSSANAT